MDTSTSTPDAYVLVPQKTDDTVVQKNTVLQEKKEPSQVWFDYTDFLQQSFGLNHWPSSLNFRSMKQWMSSGKSYLLAHLAFAQNCSALLGLQNTFSFLNIELGLAVSRPGGMCILFKPLRGMHSLENKAVRSRVLADILACRNSIPVIARPSLTWKFIRFAIKFSILKFSRIFLWRAIASAFLFHS